MRGEQFCVFMGVGQMDRHRGQDRTELHTRACTHTGVCKAAVI